MPKIKNLSRETLNFHIGGFDDNGEPKMGHVRPGQTENLTVDLESVEVKARLNAGLISIEDAPKKSGAAKAKGKAKAASVSATPPASEPAA